LRPGQSPPLVRTPIFLMGLFFIARGGSRKDASEGRIVGWGR
jgi:hypothetical protein